MSGLSVPRGPLAHHFRAPRGHPSIMGHVPFCKYFGSQVFWDPSILGALIGYTNLVGSKYYGVSFIVASIILGSDYHRPYCIWHDFKVARIWDPRITFPFTFVEYLGIQILRFLVQLNTALFSTFRSSVRSSVTGVTYQLFSIF